ncbi:MAG TPA: TolC family outer membrane protein [Rhodanobacteraceae bacterium]|nr:TolC family outer membrane protein [Rhodanobacteraceae bacterium]
MNSSSASRRPFALRACAVAIVATLGLAGAASAHAEDLMDAYRQALQSDPVLMQAEAQSRIGHEGMVQSRAVLLPQLNGSVSFNDSHGTQSGPQTVLDPTTGRPTLIDTSSHTGGRSRSEQVGLQQVLFDLGKFSQLRSSKANAASAEAQYIAAEQNLIVRVATAYFTVLNDQDQLRYAEANQKALQKQLDAAQAKYSVGLSAITDADSARAQEAAAAAAVIQARTTLYNDREALAQITGKQPVDLRVLRDKLPLNPPQPDDPEAWVKTALASNPTLQAQRDQVTAAQHGITTARAGHLPTLNASVTYSRNPSWGGLDFAGQTRMDSRSAGTTVGLILDVPLFAGGGTQSRVRQAIAQRDQAGDILEQDRRQIVANTRNAFNSIRAGISQVQAQKEAVVSAQKALQSTQAGYEVGSQTIIDVLFAQQTLFQAESNFSQARHAYVINQLNLEYAAGTLSVKDLEAVNALLQ